MGEWVDGCDLCQHPCSHNVKTCQERTELFPEPWPLADFIISEQLLAMDQETLEQKAQPRFRYIGNEHIWQWKSNAIRAMVNSGRAGYESYIQHALDFVPAHGACKVSTRSNPLSALAIELSWIN